MDKQTIPNFFKAVQDSAVKNAPIILTSVGIIGMIGTTVMAVKATPKAIKLLEEKKKREHRDSLPPKDVVKTTWKCYIPAAVTGVASTACLLKASSITTRRNAALLTAYNLSRSALSEYKDKVVETIGEKKEREIEEAIAKDKLERDPVCNNEVIITDRGTTLCYDGMFGRYFMSDRDAIREAINEINRKIITGDMYASLNDFYYELNLSKVDIGDSLGWNIDDGKLSIDFDTQLASNGVPCLVIRYNVPPNYNYNRYY